MNLIWEHEVDVLSLAHSPQGLWVLKHVVGIMERTKHPLLLGVAYVVKRGERKWEAFFPKYGAANDKTFRTLKAAKAYAVAVVQLES